MVFAAYIFLSHFGLSELGYNNAMGLHPALSTVHHVLPVNIVENTAGQNFVKFGL